MAFHPVQDKTGDDVAVVVRHQRVAVSHNSTREQVKPLDIDIRARQRFAPAPHMRERVDPKGMTAQVSAC
jgi:hypothetical protein